MIVGADCGYGAPEPKEIPLAVAKLVSAWQIPKYKQYLNGSKATRELGYRPGASVDEAIRRTFEWFRSQG